MTQWSPRLVDATWFRLPLSHIASQSRCELQTKTPPEQRASVQGVCRPRKHPGDFQNVRFSRLYGLGFGPRVHLRLWNKIRCGFCFWLSRSAVTALQSVSRSGIRDLNMRAKVTANKTIQVDPMHSHVLSNYEHEIVIGCSPRVSTRLRIGFSLYRFATPRQCSKLNVGKPAVQTSIPGLQ